METSPSYFFCKCSICFDNDSETELINCGDQFCLECLERYVEYWIRETSWGIQVGRLGCPVCAGELVEEDWMPYVSEAVMEMWRAFERKRSALLKTFQLTRACPICCYPQPIDGFTVDVSSAVDAIHQIGQDLAAKLDSSSSDWRSIFDLEVVLDLMHELAREGEMMAGEVEWLETIEDCWNDFLDLIGRLEGLLTVELIDYLLRFGRLFLRLVKEAVEFISEAENEAVLRAKVLSFQLDFQLTFPYSRCDSCGVSFCLSCRQANWHASHSQSNRNRHCPRCFVPIVKDPEGCNEINCNFCGFKFCWACGRRWTSACGIYRCVNALEAAKDDEEVFEDAIEEVEGDVEPVREPEIGVPNIKLLEGRLLKRL